MYFIEGFQLCKARSMAERVYKACVCMVERFKEASSYATLRAEIDCIKGPLKVHGMGIYMRRLGVVKPTGATSGIRLGAGKQVFRIQPFTLSVRRGVERFFSMTDVLQGLDTVWNLRDSKTNESMVLKKLTEFGVCRLATNYGDQYSRQWTFRQYQLAECRFNGVQRLSYSKGDTVSMLPGPDKKKTRQRLDLRRPLADLYDHQGFSCCPEYICMAGCLRTGRFQERSVSAREESKRLSVSGRCSRRAAGHRTHHFAAVFVCITRLLRRIDLVLHTTKISYMYTYTFTLLCAFIWCTQLQH